MPDAPPDPAAADGTRVLDVRDLAVTLDGRAILHNVSFSVRRGEVVAIVGPNGAGKTVLLRALLGVVPSEGRIAWAPGTRLGYVPQRLPYVRDLPVSVEDFLTLERPRHLDVGRHLEAVGLSATLRHAGMGHLSSGQFQRVLIAWALAGDPDVLLFDEPTTGVDVTGEETVHRLLGRLHRDRQLTMLLVTHDLTLARGLCTTVVCLNRTLLCHGAPPTALTPETMEAMYGGPVACHDHGGRS